MRTKIVSLKDIEKILFDEPEKHSDFYLIELVMKRYFYLNNGNTIDNIIKEDVN